RFAGELAVAPYHFHVFWQATNIGSRVGHDEQRIIRKPTLTDTICDKSNVLCAPRQKDDRAVVLHRHAEICDSAGYCSQASTVASVGVANFAPLVIGATGGSGTRVVARIAKLAGYNLGTKLNSAEDSLAFYSFHETWINPFVSARRRGQALTPWQSARMKEDFHAALANHIPEEERRGTRWGWKTAGSIYLLPFLHVQFAQLKFIHVMLDGRDMALSQTHT